MGFLTGETVKPKIKSQAARWREINRYVVGLLARHVEEAQQSYISHLTLAQDIWKELKAIHVFIGKRRLVPMMEKFMDYNKLADQTIDAMAADLRRMRLEIQNADPATTLSDTLMAYVIMNACQEAHYDLPKYTLRMVDSVTYPLTSQSVVDHLRAWDMTDRPGSLAQLLGT